MTTIPTSENKGRNENIKQKITWAPSANSDYISDTQETLEGILELEFGFRDSLPAAVATFCTNYCRSHNISRESAVHIGSATGRAAFELSKTFEQVRLRGLGAVGDFYRHERIGVVKYLSSFGKDSSVGNFIYIEI